MVETQSLGAILDHVNEKLFYKQAISVSEKQSVTAWLAGRQIRSGPMAGMFAPTGKDISRDFRLFTGEKPQTDWLFRNTLTTETARLLALWETAIRHSGTYQRLAASTVFRQGLLCHR